MNLYLLGDSILDNEIYTESGASTMDVIADRAPADWSVHPLAVDGATIDSTGSQRHPDEGLRVISMGGNDLLPFVNDLEGSTDNPADYLASLLPILKEFESDYRRVLGKSIGVPTLVMTIWKPHFGEPTLDAACDMLVGCFNSVIWKLAQEVGADVYDLHGDAEPSWYANPIEPNDHGSEEIATAVLMWADTRIASW